MLRNYFKIAFRNLWKNRGYVAINVVGLSVACCVGVFLFLVAYHQLSFDSFHKDKDRIFQTYFFFNDPERAGKSGTMPLPLIPALKEEYPEVEAGARLMPQMSLVEYKGKYFDKFICMTDADFLRMFSFPMLKGSRERALNDLGSIVISRSMAQSVFGREEPVGKQVQVGTAEDKKFYTVTGVLEDDPYNSSIRYDALIRIENYSGYRREKDRWDNHMLSAFVKLSPAASQPAMEARLKSFTRKYFPESFTNLKKKGARPDARGDLFALRLQGLSNVHFDREIGNGAPIAVIYALLGIALFILMIACINFINLSLARSFTRAREVGVRKSLGALKNQLFLQIWGESALICLAGFLTGALLAYMLLPEFNALFQTRFHPEEHLLKPGFLAIMSGVFILVTL
ncbi:MAG TPA: ABC transporter permease, partial [Anseongella sp.]|nr:ABC transporter permease [Anseongella sp.]